MTENKWFQIGQTITNGSWVIPIGGEIPYKAAGTEYKGKWRLFGIDAEGRLLLMSDEHVANLCIKKKDGYKKGIEWLKNICEEYGKGNGAVGARSVSEEELLHFEAESEEAIKMKYGEGDLTKYWLTSSKKPEKLSTFFGWREQRISSYGEGCYFEAGVRVIITLKQDVDLSKL